MVATIKARKLNTANAENIVNIEAILEGVTLPNASDYVTWTVVGADTIGEMTHGGGAKEGVYLRYGSDLNPTIGVEFPTDGNYNLIVKAEVIHYTGTSIEVEVDPLTGETRTVEVQLTEITTYTGNVITVELGSTWE